MNQSFGPDNGNVPNDLWKVSLENVSFRWTDPSFVASADEAEANFEQLQVTFQQLLQLRSEDLEDAYAACQKIIERTCSGQDELLEQVSLSLDHGLTLHLIEKVIVADLTAYEFKVKRGPLESFYKELTELNDNFVSTVQSRLRNEEKRLRVQEMLHLLGTLVDDTSEGIELVRAITLEQWELRWPEMKKEVLDQMIDVCPEKAYHFKELAEHAERYAGLLFESEISQMTDFHLRDMVKNGTKVYDRMAGFLKPKPWSFW